MLQWTLNLLKQEVFCSSVRADVSMGLDFDRIALPTDVVLCADLDENGFVDAVFVGMNGRDALYQTNVDGTQGTP